MVPGDTGWDGGIGEEDVVTGGKSAGGGKGVAGAGEGMGATGKVGLDTNAGSPDVNTVGLPGIGKVGGPHSRPSTESATCFLRGCRCRSSPRSHLSGDLFRFLQLPLVKGAPVLRPDLRRIPGGAILGKSGLTTKVKLWRRWQYIHIMQYP